MAITVGDTFSGNIWLYDIARGTLAPFTFGGVNNSPVWAPDGKQLAFASSRIGSWEILSKLADGTGEAEKLLSASVENRNPTSWSPDGVLAYSRRTGADGDIWVLSLGGEWEPREFIATQFIEHNPMFSPDGRWIAFMSYRSGQAEIYVKPYPGPSGIVQISTDGGKWPLWSHNGRELFYRRGDKMMAVSIRTEPTFEAGKPRLLFEGTYFQHQYSYDYDVDSEGRFLMVKEEEEQAPGQINVVENWFEELKRLVPTN